MGSLRLALHARFPEGPTDDDVAAAHDRGAASVGFVLHRFEEMTYPAIAQCLHISVSAVEKQIMNALRLLRDELEKDRR